MTRPVRVVLFATAREAAGNSVLDLDVPEDGTTVGTLLAELEKGHPRLVPVLRASRIARNGRYVSGRRARVAPGDEVAVHPPYSGG